VGQTIVLHDPAILRLVGAHDGEFTLVEHFRPVFHLPVLHIPLAFSLKRVWRHTEPHSAIDAPPTVVVVLRIILHGSDGVAEKSGLLIPRVGDERLGSREVQLELFLQERSDFPLDLFGLLLGSAEPEQEVVGISDVPQPSEVRVCGVQGWGR